MVTFQTPHTQHAFVVPCFTATLFKDSHVGELCSSLPSGSWTGRGTSSFSHFAYNGSSLGRWVNHQLPAGAIPRSPNTQLLGGIGTMTLPFWHKHAVYRLTLCPAGSPTHLLSPGPTFMWVRFLLIVLGTPPYFFSWPSRVNIESFTYEQVLLFRWFWLHRQFFVVFYLLLAVPKYSTKNISFFSF